MAKACRMNYFSIKEDTIIYLYGIFGLFTIYDMPIVSTDVRHSRLFHFQHSRNCTKRWDYSVDNVINATKTIFIRYPNEIFSWFLFTRLKNSGIIDKKRSQFVTLLSCLRCQSLWPFLDSTGELYCLVLHCLFMQDLILLFKMRLQCAAK
jgi:hypothetical protein